MKPLNRRLLIEVIEEEPQQGAFFVPVEEKVEEFLPAKVISCAEYMCKRYLLARLLSSMTKFRQRRGILREKISFCW